MSQDFIPGLQLILKQTRSHRTEDEHQRVSLSDETCSPEIVCFPLSRRSRLILLCMQLTVERRDTRDNAPRQLITLEKAFEENYSSVLGSVYDLSQTIDKFETIPASDGYKKKSIQKLIRRTYEALGGLVAEGMPFHMTLDEVPGQRVISQRLLDPFERAQPGLIDSIERLILIIKLFPMSPDDFVNQHHNMGRFQQINDWRQEQKAQFQAVLETLQESSNEFLKLLPYVERYQRGLGEKFWLRLKHLLTLFTSASSAYLCFRPSSIVNVLTCYSQSRNRSIPANHSIAFYSESSH